MGKDATERRCLTCKKLLLDEKTPFCHRCLLEGRNKAAKIGSYLGGVVSIGFAAMGLANNHDQDDDENNETGEEDTSE